MKKVKIGRRIRWWAVAAAVIFILSCGFGYAARKMSDTVKMETMQYLDEVAAQSAKVVGVKISDDMMALRGMAEVIGRGSGEINGAGNLEALRQLVDTSGYQDMAVVMPDGTRCSYNGTQMDISDLEYFKRVMRGEENISDIVVPWDSQSGSIALAVPIYRENAVAGGLLCRYREDSFNDLLSAHSFDGAGYCYLAKSNGQIFAHSNHPDSDPDFENFYTGFGDSIFDNEADLAEFQEKVTLGESGTMHYIWNGTERYMSYRPIGINGWYLLSVVPDGVVVHKAGHLLWIMTMACTFVVALFILLILYILTIQKRNRGVLEKAHMELKTLSDNMPGGIIRCKADDGWTVDYISDNFLKMLGYTRTGFSERFENSFYKVLDKKDRARVQKSIRDQLEQGASTQEEFRVLCRNSASKWVLAKSQMIQDDEGESRLYCVLVDITEVKNGRDELRYNQERYHIIMEQARDVIFEWNMVDRTIYHSGCFRQKFGHEPVRENFPQSVCTSRCIHEKDLSAFMNIFLRLEAGEPYSEGEARIADSDGNYIWCKLRVTAMKDENGIPKRAVGLITDIDEQKRETERFEEISRRDPLTSLYNRGATEAVIQEYLQGANGEHAALFLVDIDDFKSINDNMGHVYGDAVLSELARSMSRLFPGADIVGRIGGDEFVAFLKGGYTEDLLCGRAQRLAGSLRRTFAGREGECSISGSIGIARYPEDGHTCQELLEKADAALYFAKTHGKNCYALYDEEIRRESITGGYSGGRTRRRETDGGESLGKGFQNRFFEYIFHILYEYDDAEKAMPAILDLIGRHFDVSRVYVFERSADGLTASNTFEWCAQGIVSKKDAFQNCPIREQDRFQMIPGGDNIFFCADIAGMPEDYRQKLAAYQVVSVLLCAVADHGGWKACVGFDQCRQVSYPEKEEVEILALLAKIVSLFLLKKRTQDQLEESYQVTSWILNHMDTAACVLDNQKRLLFVNDAIRSACPGIQAGDTCYEGFRKRRSPCERCPLQRMDSLREPHTEETFLEAKREWAEITAAPMKWVDGRPACLITSRNITKYREPPAHSGQASSHSQSVVH